MTNVNGLIWIQTSKVSCSVIVDLLWDQLFLRMNKSRYKVYIIWSYSATDMVFNGIGAAMDWLQKQYDNE